MTWFAHSEIRTKLLAAFVSISILTGVTGYLGNRILVFCSMVLALGVGAMISYNIGARLRMLSKMAEQAASGEACEAAEIPEAGEIGTAAVSLRKMVDYQRELSRALTQIANGNFAVDVRPCGEHDSLGKALQLCIQNGRMLEQELARLTEASRNGQLRERFSDRKFPGAYGTLMKSVNQMLDSIIRPPARAMKVMTRVVEGDLTARIQGKAVGDYGAFQDVLNLTLKTVDDAFSRVGSASEQVALASGQISSGSQMLSQKAAEQASSIEEVASSLHEVGAMTKQNSENAREARRVSKIAESSVEAGVESMMRLSEAINRINASSDSTARIIKTIDSIAFQTNLLALNAAVEAARAGEAGKGFAVVAEEVRNLAMRSADAAKNTANLIEESVRNSESGVALNQEVLKNLNDINSHVKEVGAVMAEIAEACEQQSQGVEQVSSVISRMSTVTQQVAANAEESASSAEELSSQAEDLKSMVRAFRLSGDAGSRRTDAQRAVGPAALQQSDVDAFQYSAV